MKYKKVAECSPKLEFWIGLTNSILPISRKNRFWLWETIVSNEYFQLTKEDIRQIIPPPPELDYGEWQPPSHEQKEAHSQAIDNGIDYLYEQTKRFPKLHRYLFELQDYPTPQNEYDEIRFVVKTQIYKKTSYQRYETFCRMEADLRRIATYCMEYHKTGKFFDLNKVFNKQEMSYGSDFSIDVKGKIFFESELIKTLSGIDAKRLRICPICKSIFWAKRLEAPTCSRTCSNNFHQRKLRIKEYEKRLESEVKKLEKLQSSSSSKNSIVSNQIEKVNKLLIKINREKMKNGNL